MKNYDHKSKGPQWRDYWNKHHTYQTTNGSSKPKYYVLSMFPYPSGAGLHVGHPLSYVASDIVARHKRMKGYNVLFPMGFDAFGLPAEQYAIETGKHPAQTTEENIKTYKGQLENLGLSFDWSREVTTSDPKYYKWTQWIFLQLFKSWYNNKSEKAQSIDTLIAEFEQNGNADVDAATDQQETFAAAEWKAMSEEEQQTILLNYRLAYLAYSEVNWCPELGTVLANDEVKDGVSERGGFPVYRKKMRQWFLRITAYAERLLKGLDTIDWPTSMQEMQRNWIGRSEGAQVFFDVENSDSKIEVFTTRPDTIFGATFMVLAPEHELVQSLTTADQKEAVEQYVEEASRRSDVDRQSEKKVSGQFLGSYALNPFNGARIPIYIAEYVLSGYGTGAIMAVPHGDERDHAFATKFGLDVIPVIDQSDYPDAGREDKVGKMINSDFLDGMEVKDAIAYILNEIEQRGIGKRQINYKLRDAGFSRQRYWGEPFPIVYKNDLPYAIDESELPLELPQVDSFKPTGEGRGPIAANTEWINSHPGGQRETDTMPGYAGSSWYFLRYMDPHNDEAFASPEAISYWQNVDFYIGGAEHAVGHLMYSRFWHKFLKDRGYLNTEEPYEKLINQGMIQGMSAFARLIVGKNNAVYSMNSLIVGSKEVRPTLSFGEPRMVFVSDDVPSELILELGSKFMSKRVPIEALEDGNILNRDTFFQSHLGQDYKKSVFICLGGYWLDNEFHEFPEKLKSVMGGNSRKFKAGLEVEKMSKSKYNVVNPDDVIDEYGADVFRMFEMFLGPVEQAKPWDTQGIDGVSRFMRKFWRLFYSEEGEWIVSDEAATPDELKILHKTLKKVDEDIERFSPNTCVSAFMIATNELSAANCHKRAVLEPLVQAMAPFAPFITEELWQNGFGHKDSVHLTDFPEHDERYLKEDSFEYPVSINGKMRTKLQLPLDLEEAEAKERVMADETVQKWAEGKSLRKFIYVKGRIINVVVG